MTTVAILPTSDVNGERIYQAICLGASGSAGDKQSTGKTAGEALDALTAQLDSDEFNALIVIQSFRPDWFFSAEEQQRLSELMTLWRAARDRDETLSPDQQVELDQLVEAELKAATARSAALVPQLNP
jgi:hypothetical protein